VANVMPKASCSRRRATSSICRRSAMRLDRLAWIAAVAAALAGSGCHHAYIARRDGVTFQAGDAVAANKVVHVIDPRPASASSAVLPARGAQAVAAIEHLDTRNAQGAAGPAPGAAAGPGASAEAPAATAAAR
jgi:hypothetical protein